VGPDLNEGRYSPGRCARDIYAVVEAYLGDMPAAQREVVPALQRLAREKDLLDMGLPRESNHAVDGSWLYWDSEIGIFTVKFPHDVVVPVHNHGTWEIVGVYEGELDYQSYRRLDDGSREGYAELEVVENRVLGPGDFSVVPLPPHDIHGFRAHKGDMWMVGVVHGDFDEERLYFDPDGRSYVRRHQKAWRRSLDR
jgi:predicted metal-dependent enzyme (double-stranded beta helix superfamily)